MYFLRRYFCYRAYFLLSSERLLWRRELKEEDHETGDADEFLIKFKRLSYHACEWWPRSRVASQTQDKQVRARGHPTVMAVCPPLQLLQLTVTSLDHLPRTCVGQACGEWGFVPKYGAPLSNRAGGSEGRGSSISARNTLVCSVGVVAGVACGKPDAGQAGARGHLASVCPQDSSYWVPLRWGEEGYESGGDFTLCPPPYTLYKCFLL